MTAPRGRGWREGMEDGDGGWGWGMGMEGGGVIYVTRSWRKAQRDVDNILSGLLPTYLLLVALISFFNADRFTSFICFIWFWTD